jgi:signal transduction histidine kinase
MHIPWTHTVSQRVTPKRGVLVFVVLALVFISSLHYLTNAQLITYHTIYRSLYYVPITIAAVAWGVRGGVPTALAASALYLPYVLLWADVVPVRRLDNLLEVAVFNLVALVTGSLADAQGRCQRRADVLRTYIEDVLTSLPVGIVTVSTGGSPEPRNPVAVALLRDDALPDRLRVDRRYYELTLGHQPVGVRCSPLHETNGAVIGHVLVMEDLREQRRLAEQVRRAERLASLGQLAGGLAHEVRNPLSIVRATAQLLKQKLSDRHDLREHTEILVSEVDRIDRLVGELLRYAHPRAAQPAPLHVPAFVTELATAFTSYAAQHDVRFQVDVDNDIPLVHADREPLRQALLNVLINAVQAAGDGGSVRLRAYVAEERVCFSVWDSGTGIPPAIRSRIFDPFFTTRTDGTGMGLAMVARVVSDHAGTIAVHDAPAGGTEVVLYLPGSEVDV